MSTAKIIFKKLAFSYSENVLNFSVENLNYRILMQKHGSHCFTLKISKNKLWMIMDRFLNEILCMLGGHVLALKQFLKQ